jgi:hypothetical protein
VSSLTVRRRRCHASQGGDDGEESEEEDDSDADADTGAAGRPVGHAGLKMHLAVAKKKLAASEARVEAGEKKLKAVELELKKGRSRWLTKIDELRQDIADVGRRRGAAGQAASAGEQSVRDLKRRRKVGAQSPPPSHPGSSPSPSVPRSSPSGSPPAGGSSPNGSGVDADPTRYEALEMWDTVSLPYRDSPVKTISGTGPWAGQTFEAPVEYMYNPADTPSIWIAADRATDRQRYEVEAILALGTRDGRGGSGVAPYAVIKYKGFQVDVHEEDVGMPQMELPPVWIRLSDLCKGKEPRGWSNALKVFLARYPLAAKPLYDARKVPHCRWPFRSPSEAPLSNDDYFLLSTVRKAAARVVAQMRYEEQLWCTPDAIAGYDGIGVDGAGFHRRVVPAYASDADVAEGSEAEAEEVGGSGSGSDVEVSATEGSIYAGDDSDGDGDESGSSGCSTGSGTSNPIVLD